VLAKLAARGDIGADERVALIITGEGLKTLDAVRDSFSAYEVDANIDSFEAAFAEQGVSV
jgi:threonine synthase